MAIVKVHCLYYGPVGKSGIQLKTSPELRNGTVITEDMQTEIYTMKGKYNETIDSSELLYTPNGPVIRVTRIEPIQGHDMRTSQSCNKTYLIKLSDVSKLLVPLLDQEVTFPLKEIELKVE